MIKKLTVSSTVVVAALTFFDTSALDSRVLATTPAKRCEFGKPKAVESLGRITKDRLHRQQHIGRTVISSQNTVYSENFDTGAPGWTFQDLWSESFWHASTTGAFSGHSYWCGVEELGGYDDMWLQTLASPAIDLSGTTNPMLSFMHNYSVESPGNFSSYDAWDAINVRISTDGINFDVVQPVGGYPYSSAYGFHFYYGTGVAAWAGKSNGYVQATFDLAAYAGKKIWVRFELGSDEGVAHSDDPNLWGWRVDNIEITEGGARVFFDDAGDTGAAQFVAGGPGGPNLWHLTSEAAVSAPNSAACLDAATGTYLPRMKAGMVSPAIAIDAISTDTKDLIVDFQFQGHLDPTAGAGEGLHYDDLFIEVREYNNGVWSYWSYLGDAFLLPRSFAGFNETLFPLYAGKIAGADSVQFRVFILTQPDDKVVPPANVFIDDFVFAAVELDEITGLQFGAFYARVTAAAELQRAAIVDSFMATLSTFPFVEADTIAYFLYRGNANSVNVPGDANNWNPDAFSMTRISGTDLWFRQAIFEPDSRLDYLFRLNGSTYIGDPLNPNRLNGFFGTVSVLAMPDYVQPPEIGLYPGIPHGSLRNVSISSAILGNSRTIRVYTPPSYATAVNDSFPVVLFHDGAGYVNLGRANNVLDYLISENRIQPLIAVFVPPVQRSDEYAFNLTSQFESFIVDELMPLVDAQYRTKRDPSSRAMIGFSFGGLITTQICYNRPEVFGSCAPYSPSYWAKGMEVFKQVVNGPKRDIKFYLDWGTYEPAITLPARAMRDSLIALVYEVVWNEWHEGHSMGSWRAHIDNALEYFFPGTPVRVAENQIGPLKFKLYQNYPNPFNPATTISFELPYSTHVKLVIFNVLGKRIRELVDAKEVSGRHEIVWDGKDDAGSSVTSGMYFYKIEAGEIEITRKLMLMR